MKIFRIFFKDYDKTPQDKSDGQIEIKEKTFSAAVNKAQKRGKKKGKRVVMVAEVSSASGFPDHL